MERLTPSQPLSYAEKESKNMNDTERQRLEQLATLESYRQRLGTIHQQQLVNGRTTERDFNAWLREPRTQDFLAELQLRELAGVPGGGRPPRQEQIVPPTTPDQQEPVLPGGRNGRPQVQTQEDATESYARGQERVAKRLQKFKDPEELFAAVSEVMSKEEQADYPLVTGRVEDTETGTITEKGTINAANVIRFVRQKLTYLSNLDPQNPGLDLTQALSFPVRGRSINLASYLNQYRFEDQFKGHQKLIDEVLSIVYTSNYIRRAGLTERLELGTKNFTELEQKTKGLNELTRPWIDWNSQIDYYLTMSHEFKIDKRNIGTEENPKWIENRTGDNRVGRAFLSMVDAFAALADREMIAKRFGADCDLLNIDKFENAIYQNALDKALTSFPDQDYAKQRAREVTDQVIAEAGSGWTKAKTDPEAYMTLLNIYTTPNPNSQLALAVRRLIRDTVGKKHHLFEKDSNGKVKTSANGEKQLDTVNLNFAMLYAENFAYTANIITMLDVTGRNFSNVEQFLSEIARLRGIQGRAANPGQLATVTTFAKTDVPLLQAIRNNNGDTLAEVFDRAREISDKMAATEEAAGDNELTPEQQKEIETQQKEYIVNSRKNAFGEQALKKNIDDGVRNAQELNTMLGEGKEFNFEEFTKYDEATREYKIDLGKLYEAADGVIKRIRNLLTTRKVKLTQTDRKLEKMTVWVTGKDGVKKPELRDVWVTQPLGLSMFGPEVYDVPIFWQKEDGKAVMNLMGGHEIDVYKMNGEKGVDDLEIVKMAALNIFAGQAIAHKMAHSEQPSFGSNYYRALIEGLRRIPAWAYIDKTEKNNNRPIGHFFSGWQMDWFKEKVGITEPQLLWMDMKRAFLNPETWKAWYKAIIEPTAKVLQSDVGGK
ncbi:MAG TPA: hypothetical protein VMR41_03070 [Patescibacteria group bacterium]|nr:hypothetical protein [Patescibacteria group bacterium]